ncbi:MAG: tyrosine-type recombinase/integrase [Clostridia bacterium]|nr:tyrosine-type recombinase/integrase [Clostridia bacterium]
MAKKKLFKEVALKWLESKREGVKRNSFSTYESVLSGVILPIVGEESYKNVSQETYVKALESNLKMSYADDTVYNVVRMVKEIINFEKTLNAAVSKTERNNSYNFTFSEAKSIVERACRGKISYRKLGIILIMYTGLSVSELSALKWNCIDMKNEVIIVNEMAYRASNIDNTGKKSSIIFEDIEVRRIPICSQLKSILERYRSCDTCIPTHFVLTNSDSVMEPRLFQRFVKNFFKKGFEDGDFKRFRTASDMRSMFIVLALKKGISPFTLAEIVGTTIAHFCRAYSDYIFAPDTRYEMTKLGY